MIWTINTLYKNKFISKRALSFNWILSRSKFVLSRYIVCLHVYLLVYMSICLSLYVRLFKERILWNHQIWHKYFLYNDTNDFYLKTSNLSSDIIKFLIELMLPSLYLIWFRRITKIFSYIECKEMKNITHVRFCIDTLINSVVISVLLAFF